MASALDLVLVGPRVASQILADIARIAEAAVRTGKAGAAMAARMADSFDRSNDELEVLRGEMRPMIREIQDTSNSIASLDQEVSEVTRAAASSGRAARKDRRPSSRADE